jgi:hypothetical protein
MKLLKIISVAGLAAAGWVAVSNAQTINLDKSGGALTYNNLIMGFRSTGSTGSTFNLTVDLGLITDYTSGGTFADGNMHQITNLGSTDIASTYGSGWASDSAITWGVAAAKGAASKIVYATSAETTIGTVSTPYDSTVVSARNTAGGLIQGVLNGFDGQTGLSGGSYSAQVTASNGDSWSSLEFQQAGNSFGAFDTAVFENGTNFGSNNYIVSDLYKIAGSGVTYVGSFGLASDGKLYYSSSAASFSAVPEPSTYAAILGVAALGFVAVRRRRQARLAAAA